MVPNVMEIPIDSDVGKVAFLVVTQMSADELRQKVQNDLMDIKEVRVFPYFIQIQYLRQRTEKPGYG